MVTQCAIKIFNTNLLDFASNVRLRLNKNLTLTNLAIITNVSICEKWEMTFSQTFFKQVAPIGVPTSCNHNIKSHGINICNSLHCFYFLIIKNSIKKIPNLNILQSWLQNFDLMSSYYGFLSTF